MFLCNKLGTEMLWPARPENQVNVVEVIFMIVFDFLSIYMYTASTHTQRQSIAYVHFTRGKFGKFH